MTDYAKAPWLRPPTREQLETVEAYFRWAFGGGPAPDACSCRVAERTIGLLLMQAWDAELHEALKAWDQVRSCSCEACLRLSSLVGCAQKGRAKSAPLTLDDFAKCFQVRLVDRRDGSGLLLVCTYGLAELDLPDFELEGVPVLYASSAASLLQSVAYVYSTMPEASRPKAGETLDVSRLGGLHVSAQLSRVQEPYFDDQDTVYRLELADYSVGCSCCGGSWVH